MQRETSTVRRDRRPASIHTERRGVFIVIAALCLMVCMTLIAFGIDSGMISLTKTQMQSATDSAALAAAMEITDAITNAGANVTDVFAYAQQQARDEAVKVAQLNGVYVNGSVDVEFGRRTTDAAGNYQFDWSPSGDQVNVVKVIARRDNANQAAPDGRVAGMFSRVFDKDGTAIRTESISYIEPRDMVVVHDFSRSMNFDSYFNTEASTNLPQGQLEANLQLAWSDLNTPLGSLPATPDYCSKKQTTSGAYAIVTFKGTSVAITTNTKIKSVKLYFESNSSTSQTFTISNETTMTGTWAGTSGNSGKRIDKVDVVIRKMGSTTQSWTLPSHVYDTATVQAAFGLTSVTWPWAAGSWAEYVSFVKTNAGLYNYGYRDKYGGMTLMCYLFKSLPSQNQCKDLWKVRHYPFSSIKEGHELLCDYLADLGLDDHIGMVSYDWSHRVEKTLSSSTNPEFPNVDISAKPISSDYAAVKKLMHYKQAAYYSHFTNMPGGMKDAVALIDAYKREGSRPTIILMTDGNGNVMDSGENSAPVDNWNWNKLFDYDGDGKLDYQSDDQIAKCTLNYVKQAADKGYTVHAISVGVDADTELLQAVAWMGKGYYIHVPGGTSVSQMEAEIKAAFVKIAAAVPPARLISTGK
jgi:Flp pilus assembly protein TadG